MASLVRTPVQSLRTKNNLDLCLDSIFKKHVQFQVEKNEVDFIQTAVETLVEELIQVIDTCAEAEKDRVIADFLLKHEEYAFICNSTDKGINILRAGSFYEDTKNEYPDEFDYIYVICTLEVRENLEEFDWLKYYFTLNDFHEIIKDILTRRIETEKFKYYDKEQTDGNVVFFDGYSRCQGPASKLMFKYIMNDTVDTEEKLIFVDIVPAFKIIDKRLKERIGKVCNVEGFTEEIISTRSYLITNEVSFTGTEVRFTRKKLSRTHKKAYRLLKYIFNGASDGETLRKWVPKAGISSYIIKVAVIHHHYICRDGDMYDLKPAQCVLTVLGDILQFCIDYANGNITKLKKFHGGEFEMQRDNVFHTINFLDKMIEKLELLQDNKTMTTHIKPISKSVLDYIQMQSSTGELSANSSRRNSFSSRSYRMMSKSLTSIKTIGITFDHSSDNEMETDTNKFRRYNTLDYQNKESYYSGSDTDTIVFGNIEDNSKKKKKIRCCILI